MKSKLTILGIFAFAILAVAAPHSWVLKTGVTIEGDYFASGTAAVVIRQDGTNCILPIANLSSNDLAYVAQKKIEQRKAQLDAEANQMRHAGYVELTTKLIENFGEKVTGKAGWMDAEFDELDNSYVDFPTIELGFDVTDTDGNRYEHCQIAKILSDDNFVTSRPNPEAKALFNLKPSDMIRLIGVVHTSGRDDGKFEIQHFKIIETAAEKKAKKEAKRAENPPSFGPMKIDPATGLPK